MIELNEIQQVVYNKYPTYDQFMIEQNPQQLLVNFSELHEIREVLAKRRIQIKEINDIYATESFAPGIDYFAQWLSFFNRFTNMTNVMPKDTIEWVSVQLYSKYCHFYFADLRVIFEQFTEARLGKFYGSIDAIRIMSGFLQYNTDRDRILNQAKEQREVEIKVWHKKRIEEVQLEVYYDIEQKHPDWTIEAQNAYREQVVKQRMQEEEKKLFQ